MHPFMFLNLTPHSIRLMDTDNNIIATIQSHGLARVSSTKTLEDTIKVWGIDININSQTFGDIIGVSWDMFQDFDYIIVSRIVKSAMEKDNNYKDVLDRFIVPDDIVRDDNGNIIGCKSFSL